MDDDLGDELLGLIFTACHPVIVARGARGADPAAGRRADHRGDRPRVPVERADHRPAHRARKKAIGEAGLTFEVAARRRSGAGRLASVLEVIYLIFNEGYAATAGDDLVRPALCAEAQRLGRILAGLMPRRARSARASWR